MFIQIKLNLVKPRIFVAENSIEWLVDSKIKLYSKMFAIVCQKRADVLLFKQDEKNREIYLLMWKMISKFIPSTVLFFPFS